MGQANAKKRAYEKAKAGLLASCNADETIVANSAIRLFENFILPKNYTGGCYLITFTLQRFLEREHGIKATPVVGYVNDGTDDIMISHAWLDYGGRKTDLTLHVLEHQQVLNNGPVVVLDQPLRFGKVTYSYHRERSLAGLAAVQRMMADPQISSVVRQKEEEHLRMTAVSKSASLIDAFLTGAPGEVSYEVMARAMR